MRIDWRLGSERITGSSIGVKSTLEHSDKGFLRSELHFFCDFEKSFKLEPLIKRSDKVFPISDPRWVTRFFLL